MNIDIIAADEGELRPAIRIAADAEVGVEAEKAGIGPEIEEAGERILLFRLFGKVVLKASLRDA